MALNSASAELFKIPKKEVSRNSAVLSPVRISGFLYFSRVVYVSLILFQFNVYFLMKHRSLNKNDKSSLYSNFGHRYVHVPCPCPMSMSTSMCPCPCPCSRSRSYSCCMNMDMSMETDVDMVVDMDTNKDTDTA
jgi:hypothetical protein